MIDYYQTLTLGTLLACSRATPWQGSETAALTASEEQGLVVMREEEKLARDVYAELLAFDPMFSRIRQSEQRHMDFVGAVLESRGLADPANSKGRKLSATIQPSDRADDLNTAEARRRLALELEEMD
ncbi:MAG: DUF2202 domain-containing protein [Deltaproteobacteria bacterium]|nr:DUF2202 domain-containing protein [Deltaproteobacteria bacterium]